MSLEHPHESKRTWIERNACVSKRRTYRRCEAGAEMNGDVVTSRDLPWESAGRIRSRIKVAMCPTEDRIHMSQSLTQLDYGFQFLRPDTIILDLSLIIRLRTSTRGLEDPKDTW